MPSTSKSSLFIVCALAFSTVSVTTLKAETSICESPLKRICTDTKAERDTRSQTIDKIKQEIAAEADKNAAPRIAEMKKRIKPIHFFKRTIESFKIKNQEIMASAKRRMGGIENTVTNKENVQRLKDYMYKSIDGSNFNAEAKAKFKEIQSTITIGNFADFIEKTGLEDSALAQLLNSACGTDGMVENAFATTLKNERYVLLCPGFLINADAQASNEQMFNSILQAISHEMGHHIDNSKVGNDLYAPYLNCLTKNYADSFKRTRSDEKFCQANAKDPAKCNSKVVLSHAGELIADQWGVRSTNIHARENAFSVAATENMLVESWSKLCGTEDEGVHPTGDFRMQNIMRSNPEISNYLGCINTTVSKPSCTFAGEEVL